MLTRAVPKQAKPSVFYCGGFKHANLSIAGVVTRAEFLEGEKAWYKRVYGTDISKEDLADKLVFWKRTQDKDHNGEVSWHEFSECKATLILDQRVN